MSAFGPHPTVGVFGMLSHNTLLVVFKNLKKKKKTLAYFSASPYQTKCASTNSKSAKDKAYNGVYHKAEKPDSNYMTDLNNRLQIRGQICILYFR